MGAWPVTWHLDELQTLTLSDWGGEVRASLIMYNLMNKILPYLYEAILMILCHQLTFVQLIQPPKMTPKPLPPLITLEEHFFSSTAPPSLQTLYVEQLKHVPNVLEKLTNLSETRLGDMAAGAVSLQVISHAPGLGSYPLSYSQSANDQLAASIISSPKLVGLAVLPMASATEAASELHRCITGVTHHFVGALIDSHVLLPPSNDPVYYDSPSYHPFWATAESLQVPIYLHPTWPAPSTSPLYTGPSLSPGASASLGSSGFGWHADTCLSFLRLFASGLFDRYPKLKIIIGHFGETLPFMLGRIQVLSKQRWGNFQRDFRTVYDENLWITTSGVWSLDPMRCILANTKIERVLYSVDYPFQSNQNGKKWMEELRDSGLVTEKELEMICYKNTEGLLGVNVDSS
ncbi:hypothetical protein QBC35DRAFT_501618 [Podospora australis]|uniref:Amidohydrolase-related domain-containing protein n=1 Tax=Podospora australis TaxID=1536484 RepID=A0AAN6WRB3_9PEZI|nr:hypothetical protein QBC35DRAFT_501618 [Podospora australis]